MGENDNVPEAIISEYRKEASAVTHLGVWISPAVSELTSFSPCASGCVNTAFFLCVFQRHMDLDTKKKEDIRHREKDRTRNALTRYHLH